MYKLLIWKSVMDHHGPNTKEESYVMNYKPTFEELYKHLDCSMIEILSGYDKNISNRTFDMYCDEESKLKTPIVKNKRATDADGNIRNQYIITTEVCSRISRCP